MIKKIENLKYTKEDGLLLSTDKLYIDFLNTSVEIWCDTFNEKIPPKKCIKILQYFIKNDFKIEKDIIDRLNKYIKHLINEKRIIKETNEMENINEIQFKNIILPYQSRTKGKFLLLYGDTNWKIKNSEYTIEIEKLFINNKIEIIQEMEGLWTRIEWNELYNNKKFCE
jgi:hypothetical protein